MKTKIEVITFSVLALSSTAVFAQDQGEVGAPNAEELALVSQPEQEVDQPAQRTEEVRYDPWIGEVPREAEIRKRWLLKPKSADYPPSSWVAGSSGFVSYEVSVDPEAKATACKITKSSGDEALDQKTCEIVMERGLFNPAFDIDSRAVPGTVADQMWWRKSQPIFPETFTLHTTYDVSAEGEISNCQVVEASGSIPERARRRIEEKGCPIAGTNPDIYRDKDGNPVARSISVKFEIKVTDPE